MPPSPAWLEWSTAAFSRAASLDRPLLLLVTTWWSEAGRALERTAFADAGVVDIVDDRFVPVRVDADRRPDVGERYTLGGWPTLTALTPFGQPLGGGTSVDVDRLVPFLQGLADAYRLGRDELVRQAIDPPWTSAGEHAARAAPDVTAASAVVSQMLAEFDPGYGGFGQDGKRLHGPALRVALRRLAEAPDADLAGVVAGTLEAMASALPTGGGRAGAYRAAAARDWSLPERARLLDVQADAVRVFLDAWVVLGNDRYRTHALDIMAFVSKVLAGRPEGGFLAAAFDDEVDRTIYVDANCRMIRALLHAAAALDEPRLAEEALHSLEYVVPAAYQKNAGMAHYLDPRPRVRGLLGDQVTASAALLDASAISGRAAYADLAEELMRSALRRLWDPGRGALRDRLRSAAGAGDVGWLALPFEPLALNCEAASVLAQLARRTGDESLRARALDILAHFAPRWPAAGLDGACYALAMMDVMDEA